MGLPFLPTLFRTISPWRRPRPSPELLARLHQAEVECDLLAAAHEAEADNAHGLREQIAGHQETVRRMAELESERNGYKSAYQTACTDLSRFRDRLRAAEPPVDRPRQIAFLHIQKTGGNSLLQFVGSQFEWSANLQVYSPAEFDAYDPAEVAHFDLVCGHYAARNLAAVRPDAMLVTFLREPIDRLLSCYWYFRLYTGWARESIRRAVECAHAKSLIGFVTDPDPEVRMHVVDHQTRTLAGDWQTFDARPDADLLADALESLDRFHCVGVTEQMEQGLEQLCWLTGWEAPAALGRENATRYRQRTDELRPSELDALRDVTRLDAEVYQAACARSEGKAVPTEKTTRGCYAPCRT